MEEEIDNFNGSSSNINTDTSDSMNYAWLVSELIIEFETYDDLKDKYDEAEDELDDEDIRPKEEKKLKLKLKVCQRKVEVQEDSINSKWKVLKDFVLDDKRAKCAGSGDAYFMTNIFRLRKEVRNMSDDN